DSAQEDRVQQADVVADEQVVAPLERAQAGRPPLVRQAEEQLAPEAEDELHEERDHARAPGLAVPLGCLHPVATDENRTPSARIRLHVWNALMNTPQIPGMSIECPVK